MDALEKKKKEVGIIKAKAAVAELEMKILERHEDIQRMEEHIKKQNEIIENLTREIT